MLRATPRSLAESMMPTSTRTIWNTYKQSSPASRRCRPTRRVAERDRHQPGADMKTDSTKTDRTDKQKGSAQVVNNASCDTTIMCCDIDDMYMVNL